MNEGRYNSIEVDHDSERNGARAEPVVILEDVRKSLDDIDVIDGASLCIARGHIFGLLGPSGSGKTTLVRIMVGTILPSSGTALVMGTNPVRFTPRERERIGYMPQRSFLYPTLTIQENMSFVAGLYGVGWLKRRRRIRELLNIFDLWDARKRLTRDISGGMQRRLELACALVHSPELLFIDEPTTGLDPILRARIWDYLRGLRDEETTIVLTTQYMDEVEYCDEIAVMNRGRIVASGTPAELQKQALQGEVLEVDAKYISPEDVATLRNLDCVRAIEWKGQDIILLKVANIEVATPMIIQALGQDVIPPESIRTHVPSMDEVFVRLVSAHGEGNHSHL